VLQRDGRALSDPTAVFLSWRGRWSDSPRAISAELLRRGSPIRQVWVLDPDAEQGPPPDVVRVAPGSSEEREALADARWVVSNDTLELDWPKGPDCFYLQTWHGTPLKRIGWDVAWPPFSGALHHYAVELPRDVAKVDAMLSPNPYSTGVLRRSFRFDGPMLETGYPRADVLHGPGRHALRARVRRALGLAEDTQAVLYAPTWRDTLQHTLGALDLDLLRRTLGPGTTVLLRAHGYTVASDRGGHGPGVRNVTRWPDIAELILAADVVVTDYSSSMFDVAGTGTPLLFHTWDLERYRDEIRGFTFDLAAEAPGPLLRTSAQVAEALADVQAARAPYRAAYAAFAARYCPWDDGGASARVVDAVFGAAAQEPGPPGEGTRRTDRGHARA
jgi:CDP-glycerol glycerophosphotransferase